MTHNQVDAELCKLEDFIRQIQTVSFKIASIYNSCKKINKHNSKNDQFVPIIKKKHKKHKKNKDNAVPPKDTFNSNIVDSESSNAPNILLLDKPESCLYNGNIEVAPNIKINAKIVDFVSDIPNTNIFWVNSLEQFAIKINGVVFNGNIGEIFTKSQTKYNVEKCCRNNNCKNLSGCKYYHSNVIPRQNRNWISSSWIYSKDIISNANFNMRHFGNRSTLSTDLHSIKTTIRVGDIVEKYKDQTIHDILVMLATATIFPF